MEKNDIQKKILEEDDYIRCPKHNNSIGKFLTKNPDGATRDSIIAKFLMISEEKVKKLWEEAVKMLRKDMKD